MKVRQNIPDWIKEAAHIITSDIRKHITIHEIARRVATNSYSLKKGFKEAYGMGLYEYLIDCRIKKASELLVYTSQPIKAIARQVGYKSTSSFIAVFRRQTGTTPLLLRKQKQKKASKKPHKSSKTSR